MRYTPPLRSALLGMSSATAALLIGFTPSGATAATHAHALPQSITGKAETLLPCGTVEKESGLEFGHATVSPLNIRTGPMTSCPVAAKAHKYALLHYYCTYDGWTYLRDTFRGITGWANNDALYHRGSKTFCGFYLHH